MGEFMNPILLISALCSLVYTATVSSGGFPGRWAIKALSVAVLALLVRRHPRLVVGLLLGAVGDALLEASPALFTFGLVSFLCGHLAYIAAFRKAGVRPTPWPVIAGIAIFALGFTAWLWPALGPLRIPVAVYVAALSTMAAMSFRTGAFASAGALLFLASDSMLAADRFMTAMPAAGYAIWLTYYAAQLLIAGQFSFLGGNNARRA
jgi:uncharacterized membrane protein YhhN